MFPVDTELFAIRFMVIILFKTFIHCYDILVIAIFSVSNDTLFVLIYLILGIGLTTKLDRTDSRSTYLPAPAAWPLLIRLVRESWYAIRARFKLSIVSSTRRHIDSFHNCVLTYSCYLRLDWNICVWIIY